MSSRDIVRRFMSVELALFAIASSVHSGFLFSGYQHRQAHTAETVLMIVLAVGLVLMWKWPARARAIAIAAQGFALLGTLVGVTMVIIGVGPQTTLDIVYHGILVIVLVLGLTAAIRSRTSA